MNFVTPLTIDVLPVYEDFLEHYKKPFAAKLVYECSLRIYYRTIITVQQDNKCIWCECEMTHERGAWNSTTIEHMIPRAQGGADDPDNYTVSCSRCNNRRGHMSVEAFRAYVANNGLVGKSGKKKRRPKDPVGREQARRYQKILAKVNKGLSAEQRREANANRPVEEQYAIFKQIAALGPIDDRTQDKIQALEAVLSGNPNPFTPDTRPWRQFERLSQSPRLDNGPKDVIVAV